MSRPQQPELRRSGRGETDQEGRREAREEKPGPKVAGRAGPVPEGNRPGRRPEHDEDKPEGLDPPAGG